MAVALRYGASKLLARNSVAGLCKPVVGGVCKIQVALIHGKIMRELLPPRPAPYPYETKPFTRWDALFDSTMARMDENSKIILVEGPIASGKTAFANALAEDLGMKCFPAVDMDMEYINDYGYDCRQLDPQLPDTCKSYDVKDFCKNPHGLNCANYQILMYKHRYGQYIDALAHLFSTGQGVVLERSCYSDVIFLEAMYKAGYISKLARETYHDLVGLTLPRLRLPHLVVYLDVPVTSVKEKILKRGIDYEVQSKVFTPQYLSSMENMYKQEFLKAMAAHAHILIYDWTEAGDPEVVVEDIERLDFSPEHRLDGKFDDWQFWDDKDMSHARRLYADEKNTMLTHFNLGECNAPELNIPGADAKILYETWENAPGNKFLPGYNADMGDGPLTWKDANVKLRKYRTFNVR